MHQSNESVRPETGRRRRSRRGQPVGSKTGRSISLLVLLQISSLAVPLATMPFLTRVLGPAAWGHLAAIQALAITMSILVEYGFQYTATRSLSIQRDSPAAVQRIVSDVVTAKMYLSILAALIGTVIYVVVPSFQENGTLYLVGILYAIILGWSPIWYFQGMERLQLAVTIDVGAKIVSAAWIFIAVRTPADAVLVLVAQSVVTALATILNYLRLMRCSGRPTLSTRRARAGLAEGFPLFLYRAVVTIYSVGSTAVLRGMSSSIETGNYANADRLTSAAKSLIVPVGQVMFPKISRLHASDPLHAKKIMLVSLAVLTTPFAAVGVAAMALSPYLLPLFFGPNYEGTIPIFQVLCLTLPLVAASNVLGIQWMLARGRQRAFNLLVTLSAVSSIICMIFLVPSLGGLGMAWSVVIAEAILVLSMTLHALIGKEQ
ncbi:flippase [Arthrobacter sp. HMWF013]|uniref:flippase n=1 Tax=Arthrobacter sp. HMWF013 TaxID=2056849 RepID=UPI000D34845C|nr:flippase [Arthrobacter sp. HMWF013]PTT65277.1 hypothetical protein DBR22_12810 [Arthrobacter sp. HMWF013]